MDVRQLTQLLGFAAQGSLILLGSTAALAGDRPHEQPTRPHQSAVCAPNWGFNQTCWSRFPPVQGCPISGYDSMPSGYENRPSQQLYTPQNSLVLPDPYMVSPVYGNSQSPISVFPNSAPQAGAGGMSTMPSANGFPQSVIPPQQFGPSQVSPIPDPSFIPGSHGPGPTPGLPPLPSPPSPAPGTPAPGTPAAATPAPGQSLFQPSMIMGPSRQMIVRPVSALTPAIQTGGRYGNAGRSAVPATASVSSDSYTNALVANAQMMPMPGQTVHAGNVASRSQATSSAGGRYGNAGLAQQLPTGPQFARTQLPAAANYRTIPAEPLRRTP